jgi:polyvinyl alcohol dehydrogenase (cytochrome)
VYATAGTCYISEFFDDPVDFDGGACDSVMAFDMDTGERAWLTQLVPNDRHPGGCGAEPEEMRLNCPGYVADPDDDPSGAPVLHTASDGRRMIIQGQESGRITAMDPDNNGAVLWVAQAGDIMAASNGGFGGAFNGEYYFKPLPFRDGTGGMAALRASDGSRAWYTATERPADCEDGDRSCSSANWSSASAVPGAVLTGAWNGVVRSYSAETGAILWEYATNRDFETVNGVSGFGGGIGGGAPTIVDGMMYVGSGYAILGGSPGNVLLAFGLD